MPGCSVSSHEIAKHKAAMAARPKRVSVEESKNGGYIVEHDSDEYPRPKHTFPDHESMAKHLKSHFGGKKK